MASHRRPVPAGRSVRRPAALVAIIALVLSVVASLALTALPAANAAAGLDPLEVAQINKANCQLLVAHSAAGSAQRDRAQKCVTDQTAIIKWLTTSTTTPPAPSPTATATGTPTPSPTVPPTTTPPVTTTPPASSTACIPAPHLCGWPDATNTGPAPGTVFLVHAGNYYAVAGETIANMQITGCLYVGGANVHVVNSKINTGDQCYYAVRNGVVDAEGDWSGLVITDTEIRMSALAGAYGVSYDNYTLLRVLFTNAPGNPGADCMYAGRNVVIRDSYCQIGLYAGDNFASGAPHFDAVSSSGGNGIVIDHNTLLNPNPQNSAILMSTNDSPIANVTITNNLVSGGNYTVYCGTDSGGNVTGTNILTGNRFARGQYRFGPTTHCAAASPHTGNVWDDDGSAIPVA